MHFTVSWGGGKLNYKNYEVELNNCTLRGGKAFSIHDVLACTNECCRELPEDDAQEGINLLFLF